MSHESYKDGQPSFQKSFKKDSNDFYSLILRIFRHSLGHLGLKKRGCLLLINDNIMYLCCFCL